jgi:hypothetical protein
MLLRGQLEKLHCIVRLDAGTDWAPLSAASGYPASMIVSMCTFSRTGFMRKTICLAGDARVPEPGGDDVPALSRTATRAPRTASRWYCPR